MGCRKSVLYCYYLSHVKVSALVVQTSVVSFVHHLAYVVTKEAEPGSSSRGSSSAFTFGFVTLPQFLRPHLQVKYVFVMVFKDLVHQLQCSIFTKKCFVRKGLKKR